ncbi:MAG: HlyC/CorC family transporter [Proteobacteria bacterium]|nr:HlyC/CorC family transporter [Pseudomonadota bacterium]
MIYLEIFALFLLILLNGLLAMSEFAIVSSRKSRLEYLEGQGNTGARYALRLKSDPGRFLSTVQIGITFVGVIAGAFSGATLGQRLGSWLNSFSLFSPYGIPAGIGATVIAITYFSLVLGEIAPKRIALAHPESVASFAARFMWVMSRAAAPLVWVLNVSSGVVLRLFGVSGVGEATVTEDEVKSLIAEGTAAGGFVPQEKEMIEGVLRLADRPVRLIMTPRSRIVWIDRKSSRGEILETIESNRFTRFLVCDQTVDNPVGFVNTRDLLFEALQCGEMTPAGLMIPLLCIPDGTNILRLLSRFRKEKVHIGLVVDEYGATEGIVTLTDVIEAVAGELPEKGEEVERRIIKRGERSWLIDGTSLTDAIKAETGIDLGGDVKMLAGFVLEQLGHIPEAGASFEFANARFEVVDMDENRIDKVLVEDKTGFPEKNDPGDI